VRHRFDTWIDETRGDHKISRHAIALIIRDLDKAATPSDSLQR
jgi:hypothetical protein